MQENTNLDYRLLFELLPDPYLLITKDLRIAAANASFLQRIPSTPEKIIGKKVADVFNLLLDEMDYSDEQYFNAIFEQAITSGENIIIGRVKPEIRDVTEKEECFSWSPVNVPVFNVANEVVGVLHGAKDVIRKNDNSFHADVNESLPSPDELLALSQHLQNAREEERARIAREIHDELGQQMTAIKMDLSWVQKRMPQNDTAITEKFREVAELLNQAVMSIRRISSELRPSLLDDMGLLAAIEWQLTQTNKRSGVVTSLNVPAEEPVLNAAVKLSLFRILQECLTNIIRHAQAKNVWVSLSMQEAELVFTIKDDGIGFNPHQKNKSGFGLLSIKERSSMAGGKCAIKSEANAGTEITIILPMI